MNNEVLAILCPSLTIGYGDDADLAKLGASRMQRIDLPVMVIPNLSN
jgi:hypothetical protein